MTPSIEKVDAVLLNVPRRAGFGPAEVLLVRIHSDDGIMGIGSCQYETRYGETGSGALQLVRKYYTPLLIKENPLNIEVIMEKLDQFIPDHLASKATMDIALHDLKGKILNVPVYELLGGLARPKVQLLAPQIPRSDPKTQAGHAAKLVDEGFKALKLRVGGGDVDEDVNRVREVRQAVGSSVEIRIDANEYYDPMSATRLIKKLEPFDLAWVEDPLPGWDFEGFATVRSKISVPLEYGQLGTTTEMLRLVRMEAADCFKMKVVRGGGLLKCKKAAAIAETARKFLVSGSGSDTDINFAAEFAFNASTLHMTRALESTGAWFIYPPESRLVKEPLVIKDGYAYPSDKPGLGVELIDVASLAELEKKFPFPS
ncbi:MAG: mandelate racemase/muconate lactonizing enzyme family protein [Candidatus Binatia bacterium]